MMKPAILSIVRHALTTFGGGLATKGFVSTSEAETLVGAAVILVGVLWGVIEKRFR